MSDSPLHLLLGDEELLIDRAIAKIVAAVRARSGAGTDLPVTRLRAGDASPPELAELLSPSLFAEDRVVILESAGEAGKDAAALILDAAGAGPDGGGSCAGCGAGGRAPETEGSC